MAITLSDSARGLLEAKHFGALATVSPQGVPYQVLVWYMRVEDEILVTSHESTFKVRNLQQNSWASLMVSEGPRFVTARGRVTIDRDPVTVSTAYQQIVHRYLEPSAAKKWIDDAAANAEGRVIIHMAIERVVG